MSNESGSNYFIFINKILTSILSSTISVALGLAVYWGLNQILNIDILEVTNISFALFLSVSLSLLIATIILFVLQTYFFYLLDKDNYPDIGKKITIAFFTNTLFVVSGILLCFILLTQSLNAPVWVLFGMVNLILINNVLIREKSNYGIQIMALLTSLLVGSLSAILVIMSNNQGLGLPIILGFMGIILWSMLNEVGVSLVKILDESSKETPANDEESLYSELEE